MRRRAAGTVAILGLVLLSAGAAWAQAPAAGAGDTRAVDFVYPGHFAEAQARARERGRPLLIKGVAFGVDAVGAACATKGHW